jgi:carboxyl-terminal processing protease
MRKLIPSLLIFLSIFVAFGGGFWFGQSPIAPLNLNSPAKATPNEVRNSFNHFWEVWHLLQSNYYVQPLNHEDLVDGAINGMLSTLDDPNTRYLPPREEMAAREGMSGEFQGIGAEIESVNGNIQIVSPFEGSPAEAAGLQPGDILRRANGVELSGLDASTAASLVRGPAGTTVELEVERGEQLFVVTVKRDLIRIASVSGELLADGIALVRVNRFGNSTTSELKTTLETLLAANPSGLILDLRRNPGGGLTTAIEVADEFLPRGIVLTERFGDGREKVFESSNRGAALEIPLVVLVDEGSASASEVVAGAVRDRNRGILIGEVTYGKGTVQTWHRLSNGGGVRITVAEWITPSGASVDREGLTPDFIVRLADPLAVEHNQDDQLQAAVDYLLGRPVIAR